MQKEFKKARKIALEKILKLLISKKFTRDTNTIIKNIKVSIISSILN